ncbi:MAG: hypothetical protein ACLU37_06125 [Collinsella sp.]
MIEEGVLEGEGRRLADEPRRPLESIPKNLKKLANGNLGNLFKFLL